MTTMRRVVVVGNGIAGLTAGETLRAVGYDGELVVIGDELHPPYSRPALSKALLKYPGDVTSHQLPAPDIDAVERLGIRAVGVDPTARTVSLDDGTHVNYDGLVIATGTRARTLGPDGCGELTLRGLDDALLLRERLTSRPDVLVVGAGPLGMEIASSCLDTGCRVTIVSQGRPLTAQLGERLSQLLVRAATARALTVVETTAAEVLSRTAVRLADGRVLNADVVITAAGDIPNTAWLNNSGLLTDGALLVDSRGRVRPQQFANIVAAGDVATFPTKHGPRRVPLWTSAIDQSKTAALALLDGEKAPELEFRPYFWTEQFGVSLKACGDLTFDGEPEVVDGSGDSVLLRWRQTDGSATAVAVNYRIPIPKLRRMTHAALA